jgi:Putative MetA-pathway of phenol degradation
LKHLAYLIAAALCVPLIAPRAANANDPIDTDGPDFVESSEAVARGRWQYEAGLSTLRDRRLGGQGSSLSNPVLVKFGFAETLEARFASEGFERRDGQTVRGGSAIGIKWRSNARDPATGKPAIAWIAHFELPVAGTTQTGRSLRPSLRSVITWELPHDLALGLMPGLRYQLGQAGHAYTSGILGVVLNRRVDDRSRLFVEFSAERIARTKDAEALASWDIGGAYLVNANTQIGFRASVAANRTTPSSRLTLELAQRF